MSLSSCKATCDVETGSGNPGTCRASGSCGIAEKGWTCSANLKDPKANYCTHDDDCVASCNPSQTRKCDLGTFKCTQGFIVSYCKRDQDSPGCPNGQEPVLKDMPLGDWICGSQEQCDDHCVCKDSA